MRCHVTRTRLGAGIFNDRSGFIVLLLQMSDSVTRFDFENWVVFCYRNLRGTDTSGFRHPSRHSVNYEADLMVKHLRSDGEENSSELLGMITCYTSPVTQKRWPPRSLNLVVFCLSAMKGVTLVRSSEARLYILPSAASGLPKVKSFWSVP